MKNNFGRSFLQIRHCASLGLQILSHEIQNQSEEIELYHMKVGTNERNLFHLYKPVVAIKRVLQKKKSVTTA